MNNYKFFETKYGILYCGNMFDILPLLKKESVDLILTDPPYGISKEITINRSSNTGKFKGKDINLSFGEWDKFNDINEFMNFTYKWVDLADKILRPGGMFISYFDKDKINFLSYFLQNKGYKIKGYFADCKTNPVPQARKVKWMNAWEELILIQKANGKLTYNYQLGQTKDYDLRSIVGKKTKEDGERFHPCQKPVKLMKKFISYWSNENDLVLDPFAGSGTVLLACEILKRKWIGIEINKEYCEKIKKRIENFNICESLF